jgi:hypothetical protein
MSLLKFKIYFLLNVYKAWNAPFFVGLIAGTRALCNRYKIDVDGQCGQMYVSAGWLLFSLGLAFFLVKDIFRCLFWGRLGAGG